MTHLDSAIGALDELRGLDKRNAAYRFLLALCLREKERASPADNQHAPKATNLLKDLVAQFPNVARYRYELCETYRNFRRPVFGDDDTARLENLQLARELGEQLVKEQRDSAPYRINLAHIYAHLGVEFGRLGDIRQAEQMTRLSIATHRSVVDDFPGLAALSDRLSTNDKTRLGKWLLQLQRYEELVDLLQPLGDQLFRKMKATPSDESDFVEGRASLQECGELLLPAYDALSDSVGYLVALTWLEQADERQPNRFAFGRPNKDPIEMALSYDVNNNKKITRDEVPARMAREWFLRVDEDNDGEIDRAELDVLERLR